MKKMMLAWLTVASLLMGCSGSEMPVKGTFRNPVVYADIPDISITRAGEYYYMISTTMHLMPGGPVMRSKDLVNWETVSYVFDKLTDNSKYDLIGGTVYGRGQWASSIRYHNGKFYVLFSPNDVPYRSYIFTADDPAGKWELLSRTQHFHDASLFFDDDGRVYVFYGTGELKELKSDLSDVKPDGVSMKIFERDADEQGLLEGSQVVKYNGKYYLLMISMDWSIPGRVRREVCYRADTITGPYEKKVILEHDFDGYGGVGQGCIIDSEEGDWYGVIFQDRGGIGRVPTLMPCRWVDGWPMLGDENGHVKGIYVTPQMISKIKDGRASVRPTGAPDVFIPCQTLIVAIGQDIEYQHFEEAGVPVQRGKILTEKYGGFDNIPGVFAGGDCASGPASVIKAIAAAKVVAANIDEYLGYHHIISCDVEIPEARLDDRPPCGRVNMTEREACERVCDFNGVENCMSEAEAKQEASRCLRCDHFGYGIFKGGRETLW